ncbi:PstS family phosphate ABC transporter substrate-binding protein [Halalkalicoccus sp. NIPERK01]|uniref:PstS family phosphate ABC transporter substrate-binding protein n=1 Tax=Halalkalicoccus sp. NIPERK01 TaxID=3053469 RepID=UPI00256EB023|nr:PstS family phosphate ABC transporter substrate-binding protein [Halalkalicoccus sp. NIPERK01]MDL5363654.1 PstS family phosphate ABC transporter substrate-binding protein [Halalkalicoccus sp. NIPERK01]
MTDDPIDGRTGRVSRRNVLAAGGSALALTVAGCMSDENPNAGSGGGGGGGSGDIVITGSSTVYPIATAMAEEYQRENDVSISVDSTGSGGGFENHFIPGNSDINTASRPISEEEQQAAEENGITPVEFQVASDALTMAANNEADWVDCMSFDELAQIWQPNGAQNWSDVNPDWPDEPFELYGPASTSGTFDWFTENVIGEAGSHRSDYEGTEEDNIIVQGIQGSQYALGYFGYAYYQENEDAIKGLQIDGGEGCVEPSLETAQDGSYPMSRPLFVYAAEESLQDSTVADFMRYFIENSSSDLVSEVGYVPANEQLVEESLATLEDATGGN